MRIAVVLVAALACASCRSVPDGSPADAAFGVYVQAVRSGSSPERGAYLVADAELSSAAPEDLGSAARAAAQKQHALALASGDPDEALAREEVAHALLARGCPRCARERIPVLLHLAQLYAQRGGGSGLALCAERARGIEPSGLDATRLGDWPLLRQQSELCERVGDFAGAVRIERSLLDARLQIVAADRPQVAAARARIAELERLALEGPPVGAVPPDPAR